MSEQCRSAPFDEALSKFVHPLSPFIHEVLLSLTRLKGTKEARPSFVSAALGALEGSIESAETEYQRQIIKDTAAMFYMVGTDTIVASILTWIWVLLKNPDIQARVHAELDAVLKGKMPEFRDQEQLPYLMATLMESTR